MANARERGRYYKASSNLYMPAFRAKHEGSPRDDSGELA